MDSSRRDLFLDMVIDKFMFKSKQMTHLLYFILVCQTGVGLPKTGVIFFTVRYNICRQEEWSEAQGTKTNLISISSLTLMTISSWHDKVLAHFFPSCGRK